LTAVVPDSINGGPWENSYDIAVIGGGILGLATARALKRAGAAGTARHPREGSQARHHQTGNNSGVIHSGIYYKPGSYKAKLCVERKGLMLEFCQKARDPRRSRRQGDRRDQPGGAAALRTLYERGSPNGVPVEMIEPAQLREIEPHASALRAIRSPSTAIAPDVRAIDVTPGVVSIATPRRSAPRHRAHTSL